MSDHESVSGSTESERECDVALSSKAVLADIRVVQCLIDEMTTAPTLEDREMTVLNLQQFVNDWRRAVEDFECNQEQQSCGQPSSISEESRPKLSFWSRLFGGKSPVAKCGALQQPVSMGWNGDTTPSSSGGSSVVDSQYNVQSVRSVSCEPTVLCPTPKSMTVESECDAVSAMVVDDGEEESGLASLQLMTLGSTKNIRSFVSKPANVVAYNSSKVYEPYGLQTVDETRMVSGHSEEDNKADTLYSTAPVSSCHGSSSAMDAVRDDGSATRVEKRVMNHEDHAAYMREVLEHITAVFEGSEQDLGGEGLGIEVLEVAPGDENDKKIPVSPAGKEPEEVESLRSSGLVRKMVDVFSRFKS